MTNTKREEKGPRSAETEQIFSQELVMAFASHIPLLLIGPVLVALAAYILAPSQPGVYTSTTILRLDRAAAKSMEALVTSPALAERVLSKYGNTGNGPEGHAGFLSQNLRLTDTDPGDRQGERLFRLQVSHSEPRAAQSVSSDLIDAWLEMTRPRGTERAILEAELQRTKLSVTANSKLIEQLQNEATKLLVPDTMTGELATPISALIGKRDQGLASIAAIEGKLAGVSRDVIVLPPNLPQNPTYAEKKRGIAVLSGVAAIPLLLTMILLGRYFAPGFSPRKALFRRFSRPK